MNDNNWLLPPKSDDDIKEIRETDSHSHHRRFRITSKWGRRGGEEEEEEEVEEEEKDKVLTISGHATRHKPWPRDRGHGKCPPMLSTEVATETSSSVTTFVRGHSPKWGGSPRPPNREQEYLLHIHLFWAKEKHKKRVTFVVAGGRTEEAVAATKLLVT